jgi:PhzF family phenazine biosynthesis protein
MQKIAAEVGYSETVFVTGQKGNSLKVRYFSPEMEVDFCGHATIAAGVAIGEHRGTGNYIFETNTGEVAVDVTQTSDGYITELTSHIGSVISIDNQSLERLLEIFGWQQSVLAEKYEPLIANAGNSHPVLVLESIDVLKTLNYDFEALKVICRENKWPTVQVVSQESSNVWRSRNPFAFGGVYEDPATGSAALAFGVYLRETHNVSPGDTFIIKQGLDMGQPCLLKVAVELDFCTVSGTAIKINY